MEYYKNSTFFLKIFLFSVVSAVIYAVFFQDKMMSMIAMQKSAQMIQAQLMEQAVQNQAESENNQTVRQETEDEFVERIVSEYKAINPNVTPELEESIRMAMREKYRKEYNNSAQEINYPQESQNVQPAPAIPNFQQMFGNAYRQQQQMQLPPQAEYQPQQAQFQPAQMQLPPQEQLQQPQEQYQPPQEQFQIPQEQLELFLNKQNQ